MKTKLIQPMSRYGWMCLLAGILAGCASTPPIISKPALEVLAPVTRKITVQLAHAKIKPENAATAGDAPPSSATMVAPVPMPAPAPAPAPVAMPSPALTVDYHVWQALTHLPAEPWRTPRFKMYTYVLFNGAAPQPKLQYDEQQALARLNKLLETIGRAEDQAGTSENQARPRQATNLFLIPAVTATLTKANLENYDIGVSRQYLAYFSNALIENKKLYKQLRKKGPFLLSTLKPIGEIVKNSADGLRVEIDRTQPIMLVDMTGAHEKSVAEIVRTFKNQVEDTPLTDTQAFEPMRIKLVSLLLKLNDAIPIVNNAVAGTCGMVGVEAACPKK